MSILDLLTGRDSELERALDAYPIFDWPHLGKGIDLTASQREENLAWFLAARPGRVEALAKFLAGLGVELPPPGDPTLNAASIATRLDALAKQRFIKVAAFESACAPDWRRKSATGIAAAARSVAIDLGVYIGECATHAAEPFDWRVGESRYRPANMPMTAGEVVISKLSMLSPKPNRVYLDVVDWSVFAVWDVMRRRTQKAFWKLNHFEYLGHLLDNRY
ncbi:MAG: hypothetical protein RL093_1331 [Pseudomonadota bacterium]|jgi:hypothetical protein